jgi:hypothetical protein
MVQDLLIKTLRFRPIVPIRNPSLIGQAQALKGNARQGLIGLLN